MKEKDIENSILTYLNLQSGCYAFKMNTVGIYDAKNKVFRLNKNKFVPRGTSDILGLCNGMFFAIEVKTPTTIKQMNRPTSRTETMIHQMHFIDKITSSGGTAFACSSLDEVIIWFKNFKLK